MSTLSLRPDDRGGLGPTEKWSNSGIGSWGNHHQQVVNVLEPTPSVFYSSQSQSMFPHLMHDSALVQAFKMDALNSINVNNNLETYNTLLQSSNSNSMVESCTSDEDVCTAAPEIRMNCIAALGGGPVSPLVTRLVDRTRSASGAALEDWNLRMRQTRPLSSCQVNADGFSTVLVPGLKRRLEVGDEEQISGHRNMQQVEKAQAAFQDSYGGYVGVSPRSSSDPGPVIKASVVQKDTIGSGSGVTDMDSIRAILFCHASQPVPSLEEIASSRPKRRNVRISKDPQSVAARHRRERISDRMRVLQRLVPGGTKMDTASMLDEAIHYVKFLKLQLQTLEQIGSNSTNNYDSAQAGTSCANPQAKSGEAQLGRRPFHLNTGTAFQSWASNNNSNNNNNNTTATGQIQAPPQAGPRHSNQWT